MIGCGTPPLPALALQDGDAVLAGGAGRATCPKRMDRSDLSELMAEDVDVDLSLPGLLGMCGQNDLLLGRDSRGTTARDPLGLMTMASRRI